MSSSDFMENPYSGLIRIISHKLKLKSDEKVNELGLNAQQGRVIGYIYEHQQEGIIQKDLAEAFKRKEASITSMLQGLEKNGYIERRVAKGNERQKNIYVLPKGASLVETFNEMFIEIEDSITKELSEEEKTAFLDLLIKVNNSI